MTTVFPPQFRDFPRTDLTWSIGSKLTDGAAILDGGFADFSSVVGGETVTIDANGAGGTLVTLMAGDVTGAAIAARINGTGSLGTAGPGGAPLATGSAERIRLTAATSVAVTAHSGRDAFERTGLPLVTRDTTAGPSTSFSVPLVAFFDRVDTISENSVVVPVGANVMGVLLSIEAPDPTFGAKARVAYTTVWEMEDGSGVPPYTTILGPVLETFYDEANAEASGDGSNPSGLIQESLYTRLSRPIINSPGIAVRNNFIAPIPPGSTAMRVAVSSLVSPEVIGGEDITEVPTIPPVVNVSVWPGAR